MTVRVTVIGAGVGGLAAALRLLAAGAEVTVVERRARPGGWLEPIVAAPFRWERGPVTIVEPEPFRRLLHVAGRALPEEAADRGEDASARGLLHPERAWTSGLGGAPAPWPAFCLALSARPAATGGDSPAPGIRSGAVVAALASAVAGLGGRIVCADGADEILVYGGRQRVVRTVAGAEHEGDAVIANGDPIQTRRRLLRSTPAPLRSRLGRHRPGASCLLLRLGLDRRYPRLGVLTPVAGPEPLWLQADTREDAAPEGGTALTVALPVPAGAPNDERTTATLRDRLIAFLERDAGLDGLERAIVAERALGPAALAEAFDAYRGSFFDSRPAAELAGQPVRDRAVAGLFHVGGRVDRCGGLAGALASAEQAAALIAPPAVRRRGRR